MERPQSGIDRRRVTLAAGVAVFLVDVARSLRPTLSNPAGNVWNASTLEWLPNGVYGPRSIPRVSSPDPLWDDPNLAKDVEDGRYFLFGTATGARETIVTSLVTAEPQYLLRIPGPGWTPVLAAAFTTAFFILLTVKAVGIAVTCGVAAIAMVLIWMWSSDPPPLPAVPVARNLKLNAYAIGPTSHSYWAMIVLLTTAAALYLSFLFSYVYLWTVSPQHWAHTDVQPAASWPLLSAMLFVKSSGLLLVARAVLTRMASKALFAMMIVGAAAALTLALATDTLGHWSAGLRPTYNAYAAMVYMNAFLQLELVAALIVMAGFAIARRFAGRLNRQQPTVLDNLGLLWHYTVGQALIGVLLVHGSPHILN